jgi:hypothetical protein
MRWCQMGLSSAANPHPRPIGFALVAGMAFLVLNGWSASPAIGSEGEVLFEKHVRPLLVERCVKCHGSKKRHAGLRLDSRAAILAGGDAGPAMTVGDSSKSELLARIASRDDSVRMPPPGENAPVSKEQIAIVKRWIELGAPWPDSKPAVASPKTDVRKTHWAFQPIRKPELPAVKATGWVRSPLDRFVLARLEDTGLSPSPETDRATFIRRATYDLHGLPPTLDETTAFVNDPSPRAHEVLIDRLLASPRYGEHWGRYWLDVARYSDTKGYCDTGEGSRHVHSSLYRDWVIRAFNDDMPYDRFLLLQLAADQVAPDDPKELAAMGFLTLGRRFLANTPDIIDDRIDVVTRGMMGLTVGCARCHDHKYDPIPIADYYSLYGVFQNCVDRLVPAPRRANDPAPTDEFTKGLAERQRKFDELTAKEREDAGRRLRTRLVDYLMAQRQLDKYPEQAFVQLSSKDDILPALVRRWESLLKQMQSADDPVFGAWIAYAGLTDAEFATRSAEVTAKLQKISPALNSHVAAAFREPPISAIDVARRYAGLLAKADARWAEVLETARREKRPAPAALPDADDEQLRQAFYGKNSPCVIPDEPLIQTDFLWDFKTREAMWKARTEIDNWLLNSPLAAPHALVLNDRESIVEPQVFRRGNPAMKGEIVPRRFLSAVAGDDARPFVAGSGRREMAEAIVAPTNPLTARVWINRIWMHHFGAGLATSPSDFGVRSLPPSHPEMLDWLATKLRESGWSAKAIHREIMLSAAYRQSVGGPVDPAVRVRASQADPDNRLLWRMNPRRLSFEQLRDSLLAVSGELDGTMGGPGTDLFAKRRSVYVTIDRQFLPTVLSAFDFANPNLHSPQRTETTTAIQALFAMNHPFVADRSRALVKRLNAGTTAEQIKMLYGKILGRQPSSAEIVRAERFLSAASAAPDDTRLAPLEQLAQALLLSNEFIFVD